MSNSNDQPAASATAAKKKGYVAVNQVNLHGKYFEPGAALPPKLCTEDYVEPLLASGDIRAA